MPAQNNILHYGSCHCGKVKFTLSAPAALTVNQCNCSICSRAGYLSIIVEREQFELLCGEESLVEYRFNTGNARHLFCKICGIKAFYIPRSHPHGVSVNARCLDPDSIESMVIHEIDGRNWEKTYSDGQSNPFPE